MANNNRKALLALAAAGTLWGVTVPLSKLALAWLGPAWLACARFTVATPLLALAGRRGLRAALDLRVAAAGAVGFGAVIMLQNAGIERTSVTHAALLIGVVPVLVALLGASARRAAAPASSWVGYALALTGIALVAGNAASGATVSGDVLVLLSVVLSAAFILVQPRLVRDRDPAAVTAVQFAAAALVCAPVAAASGPLSAPHGQTLAVIAFAVLCIAGTVLPFWLFAAGQARTRAEVAGAFVNLEPVVGAATGWLVFGNPAGPVQLAGAVAVLAGVALSTMPHARAPTRSCPG